MDVAFDVSETVLKMSILCMNISIINCISNMGKDVEKKNTIDILSDMFPICNQLAIKTFDNEYVIMKNKYAEIYFYSNADKLQVVITDPKIKSIDNANSNDVLKLFTTIFAKPKDVMITCNKDNEISIVKNGREYHEIVYKIDFIRSDLFEISFLRNIKNKVGEAEIYVENIEDIMYNF